MSSSSDRSDSTANHNSNRGIDGTHESSASDEADARTEPQYDEQQRPADQGGRYRQPAPRDEASGKPEEQQSRNHETQSTLRAEKPALGAMTTAARPQERTGRQQWSDAAIGGTRSSVPSVRSHHGGVCLCRTT